jgi:hypothetical protein
MDDDDRLRAIAKASERQNYAHKHTELIKKLDNQIYIYRSDIDWVSKAE